MSEVISPELNATISEDDPYIKLGELTNPKSFTVNIQTNISPKIQTSSLIAYRNKICEKFNQENEEQVSYHNLKHPNFISTLSCIDTAATTTHKPILITTQRLNAIKPVFYFKKQPVLPLHPESENPHYIKHPSKSSIMQHKENTPQAGTYSIPTPQSRPTQLSNLMISTTQSTRPLVKLQPSPLNSKGLEASLKSSDENIMKFVKSCNELAFSYWKSITSEKESAARSLVMSPFALTAILAMLFLGARGSTSGEMNELLKLDDMTTFNPHLLIKNITDSVEESIDKKIASSAFVREIYIDRSIGKVLQFFREKVQQPYAGHVEEVKFNVINDIIRRRTNILIKRHKMGKVSEYLRSNSIWVNGPVATIAANLFQTDCSHGSTQDGDGEIFFQVHQTVRQRRLVRIPAVLFKTGFTGGYEPNLDATVVAFGRMEDTISMIYVMPGHLSSVLPSENLYRFEKQFVDTAFSRISWHNLLTSLMDRPGMEVQIPRFLHRSLINATAGLKKMGLEKLFKADYADFGGLTRSSHRNFFLSDMIQINTFSNCGEEKIANHHHIELYPAPPLRKRNKDTDIQNDDKQYTSEAVINFGPIGRGIYDVLLDPKYLELPLALRPSQARLPEAPRIRFDKPFLYFVRHNPTGMILFIGRFNPRLLP